MYLFIHIHNYWLKEFLHVYLLCYQIACRFLNAVIDHTDAICSFHVLPQGLAAHSELHFPSASLSWFYSYMAGVINTRLQITVIDKHSSSLFELIHISQLTIPGSQHWTRGGQPTLALLAVWQPSHSHVCSLLSTQRLQLQFGCIIQRNQHPGCTQSPRYVLSTCAHLHINSTSKMVFVLPVDAKNSFPVFI